MKTLTYIAGIASVLSFTLSLAGCDQSVAVPLATKVADAAIEEAPEQAPEIEVARIEEVEDTAFDPASAPHHFATTGFRRGRTYRTVYVDLEPYTGEPSGEWVTYDFDEVTRDIAYRDLPAESEISAAVRLLLGEVGAGRLLGSRWSTLEAVGILYTVHNRMTTTIGDVEVPVAPTWPGCGEGYTWGSCVNKEQYLGTGTSRALRPTKVTEAATLTAATDKAVAAWWMQKNGLVKDFTGGATNFVHRCGGKAYGKTTYNCDGVGRDYPGANGVTGPVLFKRINGYHRKGYFTHTPVKAIDYTSAKGATPAPGEWMDYLAKPHFLVPAGDQG